jgi:hypothetical protein
MTSCQVRERSQWAIYSPRTSTDWTKRWCPAVDGSPAGSDSNTRKRCSRNAASFDLNGRVPVIENVFGVPVLNAPGQMIMKTDTDLCIVKRLCCSETARNYASCRPFLALQTLDCVNASLRDSGVLN